MLAATSAWPATAVFRVDRLAMPAGTLINPYYMASHVLRIDDARIVIESGVSALLDYLRISRIANTSLPPEERAASDMLRMMIVLEAVFEGVRLEKYPHIPSRQDATFVWPSIDLAREFRARYIPDGHMHLCEILNGTATLRDGALLPPGIDIHIASIEELQTEFAHTRARAERYWRGGDSMAMPELMVNGQVRIVSAIPQ
jgi:hypothetical protein